MIYLLIADHNAPLCLSAYVNLYPCRFYNRVIAELNEAANVHDSSMHASLHLAADVAAAIDDLPSLGGSVDDVLAVQNFNASGGAGGDDDCANKPLLMVDWK